MPGGARRSAAPAGALKWRGFLPRCVKTRALVAVLLVLPLAGCLEDGLVGAPSPRFAVRTSDGVVVNESTYLGKWVVLDLMATWCLPCRLEVAHLREVQRAYGEDVVILSIGVDRSESLEDLDAFAAREGATWPHALDEDGHVARSFGLRIIPKLIILDPEGRVAFAREGEVLPAAIARVIDPEAPALEGRSPATQFAVAMLAGVAGFLAVMNPYRKLHRDGPSALPAWLAVAAFVALAGLAYAFAGLVSSRATYGSLAAGAFTLTAVAWWARARSKPADARPPQVALETFDRMYEASPHFALALVLALSTTSVVGFVAPLGAFVVGLAAGVAGRDAVPPEARSRAGLVGLALAGVGLLAFGARVLA